MKARGVEVEEEDAGRRRRESVEEVESCCFESEVESIERGKENKKFEGNG